jgi:hypothetical protein
MSQSMKTPSIKTVALSVLLLLVTLGILSGCKGTLESGGQYTESITNTMTGSISVKEDKFLYASDASFALIYKSLRAGFAIERNNRAYFWQISPDIKHALDTLRPKVQASINAYAAAREVYLLNPTPANQDAVSNALNKAQVILSAVNSVVSQYAQ